MATANLTESITLQGRAFQATIPTASFGVVTHVADMTLAAAKTGQLTTRTDADDGVITLTAGHGLSTGVFDIHWTESGVNGYRQNVSVTIATNAATVTGGTGDDLPTNLTNVTMVAPNTETVSLNADNLKVISLSINSDEHCVVSAGTVSGGTFTAGATLELNDGTFGRGRIWTSNVHGTNPLDAANSFTTLKVSQAGESTATFKMTFAGE